MEREGRNRRIMPDGRGRKCRGGTLLRNVLQLFNDNHFAGNWGVCSNLPMTINNQEENIESSPVWDISCIINEVHNSIFAYG